VVILIGGASHTGKTVLAQRILEKYGFPYLSIDHLKMGLIRSGYTDLTPEDDDALTDYLWPVVREMVKTAIENDQNLVVEGCYIPFDWQKDFSDEYLESLRYCCLVMSRRYIEAHMSDILSNAGNVENRGEEELSMADLIAQNERSLMLCREHGCSYILIDDRYEIPDILA